MSFAKILSGQAIWFGFLEISTLRNCSQLKRAVFLKREHQIFFIKNMNNFCKDRGDFLLLLESD
jgi:hypothetical protein